MINVMFPQTIEYTKRNHKTSKREDKRQEFYFTIAFLAIRTAQKVVYWELHHIMITIDLTEDTGQDDGMDGWIQRDVKIIIKNRLLCNHTFCWLL